MSQFNVRNPWRCGSWQARLSASSRASLFSIVLPVLMANAGVPAFADAAATESNAVKTPVRQDPMHLLGHIEDYYPEDSKRANEHGKCVVQIAVTVEGEITGEVIETSSGFPRLDEACLKMVHGKRLIPATENGRAVKTTVLLPINWSLNDESTHSQAKNMTCADIDKALASQADEFFDGWTDKDFQLREPDPCLPQGFGGVLGMPASLKRVKLLRAQAVRTHERAVDAINRIARETEAIRRANQEQSVQKTGSLSTDPEVANAAALFRSCQYAPGSELCAKRDIAFARLKTENVCMTITKAEELRVYLCDHPAGYYVASASREVARDSAAIKPQLQILSSDRQVRIFAPSNSTQVTGDTIPASTIITILFTKEVCPLDIEGAASVFRAWQATGAYQLGCWYPTSEQKWFFIGQIDSLTHEGGGFWETFPRAVLHTDGSATITEPNYDSTTFLQAFLSNRMMHMLDHTHETP
jgi:TonB family protein